MSLSPACHPFQKPFLPVMFWLLLWACLATTGAAQQLPLDWLATNLGAIQVSDSHNFKFAVFADNRDDQGRYDRLINSVNADPGLAFSLNLGDMVNHPDETLYANFFGQVAHLRKPLLTALGNHELGGDPTYGRQLYTNIFGPTVGPFYYSFHYGQTYFIVMDDADNQAPDSTQRAWLEAELTKAQTYKYRLVFLHIPLYDPRSLAHCLPPTAADQLLTLFQTHNVTQIFAGHIHGYFQGAWGGIPYIITGGAGVALGGTDPANYFFHYLKISVTPETFNVAVTRYLGPQSMDGVRLLLLSQLQP